MVVVIATKGSKFGKLPTLVAGKHNSVLKSKGPFDGGKCTHCGNVRHTRDTYFKLHGYPKWWHELQAKKKKDTTTPEEGTGKAVVVTTESQLSLCPMTSSSTSMKPGNCGKVFCSSNSLDASAWIIDSRATNHMTFDPMDFSYSTPPRRTFIVNAVAYPVTSVGTMALSPSLSLSHILLVPTLSNKLMFVSQITEELNCVVLMYSTFFLLQDVLNKKIIGCGTKRRGLYYLDDFSKGEAHHVHHQSNNKEQEYGCCIVVWDIHHSVI